MAYLRTLYSDFDLKLLALSPDKINCMINDHNFKASTNFATRTNNKTTKSLVCTRFLSHDNKERLLNIKSKIDLNFATN